MHLLLMSVFMNDLSDEYLQHSKHYQLVKGLFFCYTVRIRLYSRSYDRAGLGGAAVECIPQLLSPQGLPLVPFLPSSPRLSAAVVSSFQQV